MCDEGDVLVCVILLECILLCKLNLLAINSLYTILMGSSYWLNTMNMGWSFVYISRGVRLVFIFLFFNLYSLA